MQSEFLGYKSSQQCSTSTLAITNGHYSLPAVRFRVEVIFQWLEIIFSEGFDVKPAIRAWQLAKVKIAASSRPWSIVAGPMQAAIVTLIELGWQPVNPFAWHDRDGRSWEIADAEHCTKRSADSILRAIRQSALELVWSQAAHHRCSGGLVGIPDMAPVRRLHKHFTHEKMHGHAGMLVKIVS